MYQKTTILGNLGTNPEMRYLASGVAVTSFSVAVNATRKDGDGEKIKDTTWFRVSAFGKLAELCNQYLQKGRLVLIEGELKGDPITGSPRIYEKRDGTSGTSFELTAREVKFIGGNGGEPSSATEGETESVPF